MPEQDAFVSSTMATAKPGFIPLRGETEWVRDKYGVRSAPTNFLIDQNGRILFTDFIIRDDSGRRMVELMIEALLERRKVP